MTGKTCFALLLCSTLLFSTVPALGGEAVPGQVARRGADDAVENAPAAAAPAQAQQAGDPNAKALFESKC